MKNTLHILLCALFTTLIVAQEKDKVKIGINAGATLANFTGNDVADEYKYGFDFLAGLSLEVPLNNKFSAFMNINYERKTPKATFMEYGYDYNTGFEGMMRYEQKVILQYITVPLNIRYYIGSKKNFFINAGPYVSFYVDDIIKVNGETIREWRGSSDFKPVDFGVNLGAGTRLKVGNTSDINIELRNNFGLSNIDDTEGYSDVIKTNAFNLIVNWAFEL
ncbi:PorT family protein [Flavobacterium zepuense]|uniref:PorT family protein n=1 Tax=Flavobacterium zepuense TaxID=2593302 RepID=A0A552V8D6_9FLAO|nr:porin family protein [Flavobacterium zepuense]TRW26731.1 PorT family protein [Flavobacterium zepuense]